MAKMIFFAVLTIVVLVLLAIVYQRIPLNRRFLPLNIIAVGIFAGAAGNLIDRVIHHYVIDFFYFSLINFPVFNVADIYVTLSAIALIIVVLFYYKEEDFSLIFTGKLQDEKES
jgi:signal peptidase II